MHERLSYYVKRDSALHNLNPLTKIILALSIILISIFSPWYWTSHILLLLVIVPLGFVGKVAKEYFTSAIRLIIPAAGFIFFMQAFFQPIGQTIIFKFWFLDITQESLSFAFRIATRITVMISAFTLFLLTTHPSELMSDLTRRGLPPQFAYVIISTLANPAANAGKSPDHYRRPTVTRTGYRKHVFQTSRFYCAACQPAGFWFAWLKWRNAPLPSKRAVSLPKIKKTSLHEMP